MVARRRGVTYPLAFSAVWGPPAYGLAADATSTMGFWFRRAKAVATMAAKMTTGREAYITRLPMPDLLRWPSWMRREPRSGFDESTGISKVSASFFKSVLPLTLRMGLLQNYRCAPPV